jgi:hypothetical protein
MVSDWNIKFTQLRHLVNNNYDDKNNNNNNTLFNNVTYFIIIIIIIIIISSSLFVFKDFVYINISFWKVFYHLEYLRQIFKR